MLTKYIIIQKLWTSVYKNQIHKYPFYTYEWHFAWSKTLGDTFQWIPYIYKDRLIIPLARNNNSLFFSGGVEVADYEDAIGSESLKPEAWSQLITFAKNNSISNIELRNIPQDSSTLTFFQELKSPHTAVNLSEEDSTPILDLSDSWDGYLGRLNKKSRHELRRKMRKFEREFTDIHLVQSSFSGQDINEFLRLMRFHPEKDLFLTEEMINFFKTLMKTPQLMQTLLFLKKNTHNISAVWSFVSDDTVFLYNSGFDPLYTGAGFYLKVRLIQKSIEEKFRRFNFLQGKEKYKYDLGGRDFKVYKIQVKL